MMASRRIFLKAVATALSSVQAGESDAGQEPSFKQYLLSAMSEPDILLATRNEREGFEREFELFNGKALSARYKPASRHVSKDAKDLIVAFEVSDQRLYEARYQQPVWPHGNSGVTIGVPRHPVSSLSPLQSCHPNFKRSLAYTRTRYLSGLMSGWISLMSVQRLP
ncbi:hypothetical protein BURKHO8Y_40075 [Burkholderia sp. 8Y]|nr:hypothetical protein BURKHO8Y_40075 [Burkholderia sp. 8Y]